MIDGDLRLERFKALAKVHGIPQADCMAQLAKKKAPCTFSFVDVGSGKSKVTNIDRHEVTLCAIGVKYHLVNSDDPLDAAVQASTVPKAQESGGSNEIADEASESYEDVVIEECIEEEVLTEDEADGDAPATGAQIAGAEVEEESPAEDDKTTKGTHKDDMRYLLANADLEDEDAQIELARKSGIEGDEPMKRKGKGKGKGHKRKKETGEDKPAAKRKAAAKSNKRKRPDPENPFDTPLDDDQKKLTELSTVKVTMPPKNTVKPESKVEVDEMQSKEKEEPKEVPKEKEEPKKVSKEKEEPKEVPKEKEEPKELAKEKDEPKEVPKEKEKPKEVPKEKEEPKELTKVKGRTKGNAR
eukprot:symbB.v1.2.012711.t1/scaffold882.1/size155402/6